MDLAFASASGSGPDLPALLDDLCDRAVADLGPGDPPDAAFLFVTPDFGPVRADAGPRAFARVRARHLLGCTGIGVIGSDAEREGGRSAALLLARLPGVRFEPCRVVQEDFAGGAPPMPRPGDGGAGILLADPYTIDAEALLASANERWPTTPTLGGLASGGDRPGVHALFLDGETHLAGAAGLAFSGPGLSVRPLVSQGCGPIGRRYVVTSVEGPRIRTLAGKPAVEALRATFEDLSPEDRARGRTGLHLGVVAQETRPDFHRGDFLVRNILGMAPEDGSLVVGDHLSVGQTVQFQMRDASAAAEDLAELLQREAAAAGPPAAGLLFSCGGRGVHLFGEPDHDLGLIRRGLGPFPLAGFFCNGEIGPVGDRAFLHGFTSSLALFRPA